MCVQNEEMIATLGRCKVKIHHHEGNDDVKNSDDYTDDDGNDDDHTNRLR